MAISRTYSTCWFSTNGAISIVYPGPLFIGTFPIQKVRYILLWLNTLCLLFSWIVYQSKRFRAWGLIMRLNCAYVGYIRLYVSPLRFQWWYHTFLIKIFFCAVWARLEIVVTHLASHESLTLSSHVILKFKWWGLRVRARNLRQLMTISHLIFYSNYGKLLPGSSSSNFVWYLFSTCHANMFRMFNYDVILQSLE